MRLTGRRYRNPGPHRGLYTLAVDSGKPKAKIITVLLKGKWAYEVKS